ncbi:hypothetical protein EfmAA610_20730 [Enterococcus faecium]|nr:hypothetical protein EfmAA610_20730 [Enterococcus faecium]
MFTHPNSHPYDSGLIISDDNKKVLQWLAKEDHIQFASAAGQQIKTIVVTSSGPGEGKSTIAANIAVVFAKSGQRVLLVIE